MILVQMYNIFRLLIGVPDYSIEPFNDSGGGDVTNLLPFWEGTAQKQPLPVTYLTNPLVK